MSAHHSRRLWIGALVILAPFVAVAIAIAVVKS
jgi:hypothetical protein